MVLKALPRSTRCSDDWLRPRLGALLIVALLTQLAFTDFAGAQAESTPSSPTPSSTELPGEADCSYSESIVGCADEPAGCLIDRTAVATIASQHECDALIELYDSTNGEAWTNQDGWATPTDPCTWFGVECDDSGVSSLILFRNGLDGEIPASLGDLANLRILRLFRNELSGQIPPELGNLSNLRQLWLRSNELTGAIPTELGQLSNLEALWLYGNELSGEIPASLAGLSRLRVLHLYDNNLTGELPAALGNLQQLKFMRLQKNQLTGPIPAEFGGLASISAISLYDNALSGQIPAELGNLRTMRTLWLESNELTGSIPPELGNLHNLLQLRLSNNQLSGDLTAAIEGVLDTVYTITLADGPGGNNCLVASEPAVETWLDINDPQWQDCQSGLVLNVAQVVIHPNTPGGTAVAVLGTNADPGTAVTFSLDSNILDLDPRTGVLVVNDAAELVTGEFEFSATATTASGETATAVVDVSVSVSAFETVDFSVDPGGSTTESTFVVTGSTLPNATVVVSGSALGDMTAVASDSGAFSLNVLLSPGTTSELMVQASTGSGSYSDPMPVQVEQLGVGLSSNLRRAGYRFGCWHTRDRRGRQRRRARATNWRERYFYLR